MRLTNTDISFWNIIINNHENSSLILVLAGAAYMAFRFLTWQKYKKSLFGTQKISDQNHEVPLGGNVFAN